MKLKLNKNIEIKSKRKLARFQFAKLNKWHDFTSSHDIETSCHRSLPHLASSFWLKTFQLTLQLISSHRMWCLFITSHLKWIEMTWPHLMSPHFIVRHPISQPFVSSHHVSYEKNVSCCSQGTTTPLSWPYFLLKVEFWGHKLWIVSPLQPQRLQL